MGTEPDKKAERNPPASPLYLAQRDAGDDLVENEVDIPFVKGPDYRIDKISAEDRLALRALSGGRKRVVEIGTFLGGSALEILAGMPEDGHLLTIDTYRATPLYHVNGQAPDRSLVGLVADRLDDSRVTVICGAGQNVAPFVGDGTLDMVFLDGAHDYEGVKRDLRLWMPKLKPDGIMTGHDYDRLCRHVKRELMEAHKGDDVTVVAADPDAVPFVDPRILRPAKTPDGEDMVAANLHLGVFMAIDECFREIGVSEEPMCSVWYAKPEWARNGKAEERA